MQLKPFNSQSSLLFSLILIAPFFFWGTAMVAMKGSLPHTTPFFVATMRLVPAGLLILIAGWLTQRPQPQGWKAWLWISLFALVDGILFQGFLAQGLVRTNAGLGSVMIDSQPLAVALLAAGLFGETIGLWGAFGLILGISGISLIGLPDEWILGGFPVQEMPNLTQIFQNGQGLMLFAALSMAVGTILIRYVSRHADPVMATGWHMILGGLPLMLASGLWETHQWDGLLINDWIAIAYSTIFGSAIAYGLFFYFASSGNLTSLSSLTFLTPVFALLFGNLILEEILSPLQWLGVGLTLISIYLVNQREILAAKFNLKFSPNPDASLTPQIVEIDKHNL
ncbi:MULTISPECIES: DMT family transporter [unclassified Roseofilum]|uniref:DMT family transporter n=1 Tax=unclassified Roseofilum TaxID=2620099 RepID=UPI000E97CE2E|nr:MULTISPECIES: DMT family transporter [unclassified Roseofilum]MBP0007698.1 DMT family transporter [Roseofilum sp. Belize Diploria]MBP0031602.1 DMT family transporter [Roseofilum sp. Belize BBD 4]HBR00429.1 EamA family transporter [Cyanobacteria bacterium UBA11691]